MTDRRELHFTTLDQLLTEARRLAETDHAGQLKSTGTWTLGQAFGHIAGWATAINDGTYPKVPFIIRVMMRLMKNRMINAPMKPGVKIPGIANGTLFIDVLTVEDGLSGLFRAVEVIKATNSPFMHPLLGLMTPEQFIALNLRHAELHLSYFQAKNGTHC